MRGSRFARRVALVTVSALAVATPTVTATAASSGSSLPGTVVVASGKSAFSQRIYLEAGDSDTVVAETGNQVLALTSSGQVTSLDRSLSFAQVLGQYGISYGTPGQPNCLGIYDFATKTAIPLCDATFAGISATNLYQIVLEHKIPHLWQSAFDGSGSVDLGPIPKSYSYLGGANGILVSTRRGYSYWDYQTGSLIRLSLPSGGGDCGSVGDTAVGCWRVVLKGYQPLRVALDGSGWTAVAPPAEYTLDYVEVTDTTTAWHFLGDPNSHVRVVGSKKITSVPSGWSYIGAGDTAYSASFGGEIDRRGDDHTVSNLYQAALAPLKTASASASPGRVAWSDNTSLTENVWDRDISNVGGSLSLGTADLVADHSSAASIYSLQVRSSSVYVAFPSWTTNSHDLTIGVAGESSVTQYGPPGAGLETLSGARMVYDQAYRKQVLVDLRTSHVTKLPRQSGYSFWGDYVGWTHKGVSSIENLTTGTVQVLPGSGGYAPPSLGAGHVLWLTYDSATKTYHTWMQSLAPGSQALDITTAVHADAGPEPTSNGLLINYRQSHKNVYQLLDYTTLAPLVTLPAYAALGAISSDVVSWIDSQGRLLAAPLPHEAQPPISLGDQLAPDTFANDGTHTWDADFPFSAGLDTCTLTITQNGTDVADVPCDSQDMTYGDAAVSWDGRDNGGNQVASGLYTWTLSASNDDGQAEWVDTTAHTFTGSITVNSS